MNKKITRNLKIFLLSTTITVCLSGNALADNTKKAESCSESYNPKYNRMHATDKDDDIFNNLMFRFRVSYSGLEGKHKNMPEARNENPTSLSKLLKNGIGAEAAINISLNKHLATELSIGLHRLGRKSQALNDISTNYGLDGASASTKGKHLYLMPLSAIVQYYIAPYGGVSPYIGLGYSYIYTKTDSKAFKIKNMYAPVGQVGVDFVAKDNFVFNIDVKYYKKDAKITYLSEFVGQDSINGKIKMNPLIISAGFAFKF